VVIEGTVADGTVTEGTVTDGTDTTDTGEEADGRLSGDAAAAGGAETNKAQHAARTLTRRRLIGPDTLLPATHAARQRSCCRTARSPTRTSTLHIESAIRPSLIGRTADASRLHPSTQPG
jgi:hypothetical protein